MLESDAARADAWHHRADAITSAAALVGITIAIWGPGLFHLPGLVLADEAAAMIASGIILFTGLRLMRPSLRANCSTPLTPILPRRSAPPHRRLKACG
jgi:divalent metal cation (Fe/Co/Zn/Cd) transporter